MCGIVGAIAKRDVSEILLAGLIRLEYRGYDSAGLAVINANKQLQCLRVKGKVNGLQAVVNNEPMPGQLGIAHTRWATHGVPSEWNAHPHISSQSVAVVHNGIIENFEALRGLLIEQGYQFQSDTDTEVVPHLFHQKLLESQGDMLAAALSVARLLKGAFALGIISQQAPDTLIAIRQGSPLVVGVGVGEQFIASDHLALLPVTQQFIHLEDGDVALLTRDERRIFDRHGEPQQRLTQVSTASQDSTDKGEFRHFMLKEIYQQATAIAATLEGRLGDERVYLETLGDNAESTLAGVERVQIAACGTSYHAGLVARYWLESLGGIPCRIETASEIRYRQVVVEPKTLFLTISQSGETADTLAALRDAKQRGYAATMTICNVAESALVRESDLVLLTRAGVEIGVASTKAFTTQLTALLMLTSMLGRHRQLKLSGEHYISQQLRHLPQAINEILKLDSDIAELAKRFADKQHALYLGRGIHYPIALEGALKLKEISYIHAEAYPSGELKHGPLALVDKNMPVIAVAPNDRLLEKLKGNLHEVRARGGELFVFADVEANLQAEDGVTIIPMPHVDDVIAPIVYTIPLQLLAYHVAVLKGTDVDQPRNLAKSVTVE